MQNISKRLHFRLFIWLYLPLCRGASNIGGANVHSRRRQQRGLVRCLSRLVCFLVLGPRAYIFMYWDIWKVKQYQLLQTLIYLYRALRGKTSHPTTGHDYDLRSQGHPTLTLDALDTLHNGSTPYWTSHSNKLSITRQTPTATFNSPSASRAHILG